MDSKSLCKGKVYLLVVDVTEDFSVAVEFASHFAKENGGHLALLHVIDVDHFDHWSNIEERVKKEMREQAEAVIWEVAGRIVENTGILPMICIEEGVRSEVIVDTVNTYPEICLLILGGDTGSSNPGPLVSYFSGKGMSRLRVPLLLVPSHLKCHDLADEGEKV